MNVWDNGYPSGGNYWSDYTGFDVRSGPNQDQPGSNGIGDTPYVADANNVDHYPLGMFTAHRRGVGGEAAPIIIATNKLELSAPYIGLTILLAVALATVVYPKKRKKA